MNKSSMIIFRIQLRSGDFHLNVFPFLEPPHMISVFYPPGMPGG